MFLSSPQAEIKTSSGVKNMNRIKDKRNYRQRGMIYQPGDVNALRMHPKETLDHWITKAILFRLLRKMGHDVITEFEITGMGVGDVFDLTTRVQYEVETTSHSKFLQKRKEDYSRVGVEVIVIPLARLPEDMKGREKELEGWVWG
jgi:hypothetical protein